ncbi:unnamed protein product [marine sediment metagenome]|uniref:Uncharacterized protein n=1 Tax=marine sediment metagenome TaxID=412755 RepID=X1CH78_9ZZZZ
MPGAEIIESACGQIITAMKEGQFTKNELKFLLRLFQKIVESTEKLLKQD